MKKARPKPGGEPELPIRMWEPTSAKRARVRRRIIVSSAVALAVLGFTLPTFFFPKFTISLRPKIEFTVVKPMELVADPAANAPEPQAQKIPALLITVEKSFREEFDATGKKFFQERASGEVEISNAFSSSPQTLVAGTRLQDPSGKIFRLRERVIIPGAKVEEGKIVPTSLSTEVVADAPGEAYNIGPTEFRIPGFRGTPKYQGFSAKSEKSFAGGFEGEASVVLSEDIARASETLTRKAFAELRSQLETKSPSGQDFFAPPGGREIVILAVESPKAGERYGRFPVTVSARGRLMAVKRSHITEVLATLLLEKNAELPITPTKRQPDLVLDGARIEAGTSRLRLPVAGKLAYYYKTDIPELTDTLRSSSPRKAESYLRGQPEIESFTISRFPPWLWFIPGRSGALEIRLETPT